MNKLEYLKEACNSNVYLNFEWLVSILSVTKGEPINKDTDYSLYNDGATVSYWLNDEYHPIEDVDATKPMFVPDEPLKLKAGDLPNLKEDVDTTLFRVIVNLYCFIWACKSEIPYQNRKLTVRTIENLVNELMVNTPEDGSHVDGKVTSKEFVAVQRAIETLGKLSNIIVYATTKNSLLPAPGIKEKKAELLESMKKRGIDINTPVGAAEYQNELKKFDTEHMKKDPAFKHGLDGKTSKSRFKLHASYGKEAGMGGKELLDIVTSGLKEGLPKDAEEYTNGVNAARSGSVMRGKETVNGGVLSTLLARLVYDLIIDDNDCGSKDYLEVKLVDTSTKYHKQYTSNMELIDKDYVSRNLGKVIKIRSPLFCKSPTFCKYCVGERLGNKEKTVQLFAMDISGKILNSSMKAVHGTELKTVVSPPEDLLS